MSVLRPELAPRELRTPQRKLDLVAEIGPDELVLIRFDHAFSQLTPEQFAEEVLAAALRARHVVVGANFRYGHRAAGSPRRWRRPASGSASRSSRRRCSRWAGARSRPRGSAT